MASHVPKFASFRPKPKVEPVSTQSQDSEGHGSPRRRGRKDQHGHAEKRERDRKPKPRPSEYRQLPSQTETDAQKPYYADRRGDPAILTYGSLNRYNIPRYRRSGYGSVLGLPGWRIDREQSSDKAVVMLRPGECHRGRLLASKHALRDSTRSYKFVKANPEERVSEEQEYIALPATHKRRNPVEPMEEEPEYRSLERQSEHEDQPDSDLELDQDEGEVDSAVTQRNTELIHRTQEQPQDLQAWLDLADHQQAMLTLGWMSTELQRSDRRSLAEVRISTYEQAIRKMGNVASSQIQLHLRLLMEASFVWEEDKLTSKWKEVLSNYPNITDVWIKYLDFVQSRFSGFKYETCQTAFHQTFAAFRASRDPASSEMYLHVMVRLTFMLREAGYQELALAIWQALLEYRLLRPPATSHSDALTAFEEFWDSEVPRIGEEDALGWRNYSPDGDGTVPASTLTMQQVDSNRSKFDGFRVRETDCTDKLRYPGRTQDDLGEDDPFHLVLFSDLEPFLDALPTNTPESLLMDAFLCFCRMSPPPQPKFNPPEWWLDPFLSYTRFRPCTISRESIMLRRMFDKYVNGPRHFNVTVDLLIEHGFPRMPDPADLEFLRHALKLLAATCNSAETIGEYLIALELHYFPSEVTKTAKKLLKARPTSSRLYHAYGLSESRRGNSEKADQVYRAALSMHGTDLSGIPAINLDLFKSWVWEAFRREDNSDALWRLVSWHGGVQYDASSRSSRPNQTSLLRTRTLLNEANERALLSHDHSSAVTCTSLLALLAYLSSGDSIDAALPIYAKLSAWFSRHDLEQSPAAELHAQSITQFLTYHATTAAIVKPSLIRTALEPLIARFPDNTLVLSLYAANESRFAIDDRVRSVLHAGVLGTSTKTSIVGWFFAIHHELQRGEIAGSTSHSVRALMRKAENEAGAHCPALWRSYVLFELEEAEKERQKRPPKKRKDRKMSKRETRLEESCRRVKETFFRGLTNLPWCKEYMMLAFTHLNEVLNEEDLGKVYNVMVEKELRIYVDLDLAT